MFQKRLPNRLISMLSSRKYKQGSYEKISHLLREYPQLQNGRVKYLVAGSWAIDFISNRKMKHDDIDLILLDRQPFYFDDAVKQSEKARGIIPLPRSYFYKKHSIIKCSSNREKSAVYIPNLSLQICFKLIGELDRTLSERAVLQLKALLDTYRNPKRNTIVSEVSYILKRTVPDNVDAKFVSNLIFEAVTDYKSGKTVRSIEKLRKAHKIINSSLRKEFRRLGVE